MYIGHSVNALTGFAINSFIVKFCKIFSKKGAKTLDDGILHVLEYYIQ